MNLKTLIGALQHKKIITYAPKSKKTKNQHTTSRIKSSKPKRSTENIPSNISRDLSCECETMPGNVEGDLVVVTRRTQQHNF